MKIHEYQAKEILEKYNVAVPAGIATTTVEETVNAAKKLKDEGASLFVVKAQIHAGGRGKGRTKKNNAKGVILCKSIDEVKEAAESLLGDVLVTIQTGEEGQLVQKLYVTDGVDIKSEFYLGILMDRAVSKNVIMASTEGGVEIEKVAEETPDKIVKEWVEPGMDLQPNQARRIAFSLGLEGDALKKGIKFIQALYKAYEETDASMFEINPLIVTPDNDVYALDAKVTFDDNALYRHKDLAELKDEAEEDPSELEAQKYDLNYIKLDGNVGCMVNGAGLAMATMDIIKLSGGEPANFLDVGGGANVETVKNGFRIILEDQNVKAILINIFGGIVRCDRVANGVIEAVKDPEIAEKVQNVPIIVRLQGTNAKEAKEIIDNSDLNVISAVLLKEAAEEVSKVLA
ncbi:MAG: ADP-forming succinate--CoA ligase subunit beta [Balneola sp.]|jgi:succinyl-CoA synthetase beta subunit|nr:ADP-forming succinate--CoA ligase subunit beta [Balneola sp.]MBE78066.1 ADP-forming succinate--CoA ligase subunit beta [Balneola sp.]HBX65056.1 ADP-forming succinate--CoA ligase subunit beta [Balneolaceae bacterium]|tara:strand:- start:1213 stop:2418 length:1206 start_codon:yes stop_codon:yes gene_type:complete